MDWLFAHVEGFQDRRDARKYASKLLKVMLLIFLNGCSWLHDLIDFVCLFMYIFTDGKG